MTLELPLHIWGFAAIFIFVGGKLMQAGGVLYARGQDWQMITLVAALCLMGPIWGIGIALLIQNFQ